MFFVSDLHCYALLSHMTWLRPLISVVESFFSSPKKRARLPDPFRDPRPGPPGGLRLDQPLQHPKNPLDPSLPDPHRMGRTPPTTIRPSRKDHVTGQQGEPPPNPRLPTPPHALTNPPPRRFTRFRCLDTSHKAPTAGFEPATLDLGGPCSVLTELRGRGCANC